MMSKNSEMRMHIISKSMASIVVLLLAGCCAPNTNLSQSSKQESTKTQEHDSQTGEPDVDALSDIDAIIKHQDKRFSELQKILDKDPKYRIKFPGRSADNHALGVGIARGAWGSDPHRYDRMNKHIASRIAELVNKYPGRILFGLIGDYAFVPATGGCDSALPNTQGLPGLQPDGSFVIHIWGANEGNFNYPLHQKGPFGGGQATCFSEQRPGVFGISTMPPGNNKKALFEDDKLLPSY